MSIITIGDTPLSRCGYLSKKYGCAVYIKKEYHNPNKSSKDRPAWYMIMEAIRRQRLSPGGTFVEASSGNTGICLASMARQLGYRAHIFVSKNCSPEKLKLLEQLGADVEICDNSNGINDRRSTQYQARSYAEKHRNVYFTDQYSNDANYNAHFETTGPEIWTQSQGRVSHFFAGIGTGGTISGVGNYLKTKNAEIEIYGVEPRGSVLSEYLAKGTVPSIDRPLEQIEGIGRTFVPAVFRRSSVDYIFQIDAMEAERMAFDYYDNTQVPVGFSSAAVLAGLDTHVKSVGISDDAHVVLLFADYGDRYRQSLYSKFSNLHTGGYDSI